MPSSIAKRKKEKRMKTTLIRLLAVATLASSMSAFAAGNQPKATATNASSKQDGCAATETKKEQKAKSQGDAQQNQNEKEFEHMLMGIYG
jgi:ribosomal protein L12E/L44/L45/RPP1/RPP2